VPESFKVLVRELQSLGVNVELLRQKDGTSAQAMDVTDEEATDKAAAVNTADKE